MPVETEIKLRLPDGAESARRLLEQKGFRQVSQRHLEADQVYDLPGQDLRFSARLLRLRQEGDTWTLTYKGPPDAGPHKSREEIETIVEDGPALHGILTGLGYVPSFRYEKYRTKFRAEEGSSDGSDPLAHGLVTLDETPIGDFMELEGPGYWIDATAAALGFTPQHYITRSYAALYEDYRRANPNAPGNMIFS